MPKYKHFKGGIYEVLFIAIHSETEEKLVIYKNSEGIIFARPYAMFFENVLVNGELVPRFGEIDSK
ncbi:MULTISPECIES: DUF1653 domain-containing protein [unclassified Dehalobacter]|uniref:DUF1653 domain-containing protein n=1 Tax=unclassified Dehalobacter TaxID=2635733 RepID=UPI000E6D421B|nr:MULTISPECIES: DUF1653 domain-containing protein [unclassified Dehalobacter]RJE47522.1 hypothetical protein A7K50_02410 [Dehalobacter sp. MCB1]TCX48667.1 DUF1653 domain-containing protein [Dehalobacter sp. 14DCB1]TCX56285.1 DUF1653 domain-containing protein [Dehalobacter sp. 12DCB1]